MALSRRTAICGVGQTGFSKRSGVSTLNLALRAAQAAIDDAGMTAPDIDGVILYEEGDSTGPMEVAAGLGIPLGYNMDIRGGGSTAEHAVATAAAVVDAGLAQAVLVLRAMNGRSGVRVGHDIGSMGIPHFEFMASSGLISAVQMFALLAQRHMREFGTTKEHLGHIAVTFREHAGRNPDAMMHGRPLTMEQYLDARPIADPLGLFDCSIETDAASAVIVTSTERAVDCRSHPVLIAGATGRTCSSSGSFVMGADVHNPIATAVAQRVYAMSGLGPEDVDVASFYDSATILAISQIESFGFAERGEGGPFAADGNLRLDGRLPANTAGGLLSEGLVHGMNNVVELVRQVRHDHAGTDRQVAGAAVGLCAGWESNDGASALILERAW